MGIKMKKGFTFIEMVVVIAIISVALPTLYTILFIILQQQVRMIRLNQVKKEGTYIADMLTTIVRNNATGIYSAQYDSKGICAYNSTKKSYSGAPANMLWFKDRYANWFNFNFSSDTLASRSSVPTYPTITNLNSDKVLISNFTSQCSITAYATPLVIFTYDICFNLSGSCGSASNIISFHFQPTVKLRNY